MQNIYQPPFNPPRPLLAGQAGGLNRQTILIETKVRPPLEPPLGDHFAPSPLSGKTQETPFRDLPLLGDVKGKRKKGRPPRNPPFQDLAPKPNALFPPSKTIPTLVPHRNPHGKNINLVLDILTLIRMPSFTPTPVPISQGSEDLRSERRKGEDQSASKALCAKGLAKNATALRPPAR